MAEQWSSKGRVMVTNKVAEIVRDVLPDHSVSVLPGGWRVVSGWNWIRGKPKSNGNFYGLEVVRDGSVFSVKMRLINIPQNYIPLAGVTYALLQIGWGDWLRMPIALVAVYSVVGWHFRKEYLFYRNRSKELLARLNSLKP